MTCIVGYIDNGKVYIGGDSAGVAGYDIVLRKDAKVFKNGDFLFGFTSSFRMGQILQYNFDPPKHDKDIDVMKYMVSTFIDAVRTSLKSGGYTSINNNEETGGQFLVGYMGHLFTIDSDFQVGEAMRGYDAVGCGKNYALGALFATPETDPEAKVRVALEAAEAFSNAVSSPFIVLSI